MSFLFINAFLYTDDYISNRFNNPQDTGLLYIIQNEMDKSVYSSLVGLLIGKILTMIFEAENEFRDLLRNQSSDDFKTELRELIISVKKKSKITVAIIIALTIIYIYIYPYSQLSWIQSTGISILFNILFPLVLCFLVAIIRTSALKCKCSLLFNLALFIYSLF